MPSELMRLLQGFFGRFFQLLCLFSSDLQHTMQQTYPAVPHIDIFTLCKAGFGDPGLQVDSVGVQIHTDNIWWGVVKVKVAGVHAHYERTRSVEDARQRERAQWDVGTLPLEGKDHLRRDKRERGGITTARQTVVRGFLHYTLWMEKQ